MMQPQSHEDNVMKSTLRIDGTEIVVENVIPLSEEFYKETSSKVFKNPENYDIVINPQQVFGKTEEESAKMTVLVLNGLEEGNIPVVVEFYHKGTGPNQFTSLFMTAPGFVTFSK